MIKENLGKKVESPNLPKNTQVLLIITDITDIYFQQKRVEKERLA